MHGDLCHCETGDQFLEVARFHGFLYDRAGLPGLPDRLSGRVNSGLCIMVQYIILGVVLAGSVIAIMDRTIKKFNSGDRIHGCAECPVD